MFKRSKKDLQQEYLDDAFEYNLEMIKHRQLELTNKDKSLKILNFFDVNFSSDSALANFPYNGVYPNPV